MPVTGLAGRSVLDSDDSATQQATVVDVIPVICCRHSTFMDLHSVVCDVACPVTHGGLTQSICATEIVQCNGMLQFSVNQNRFAPIHEMWPHWCSCVAMYIMI